MRTIRRKCTIGIITSDHCLYTLILHYRNKAIYEQRLKVKNKARNENKPCHWHSSNFMIPKTAVFQLGVSESAFFVHYCPFELCSFQNDVHCFKIDKILFQNHTTNL